MLRLSAIFIAVCIGLISSSLSAVLYLLLGFTGSEATIAGVAALSALILVNSVTTRLRDRGDASDRLADLSRATSDLARQVASMGGRLESMESDISELSHRANAATEPLSTEIEMLGTLVKQLADSVAAHESTLVTVSRAVARSPLLSPQGANMQTAPAPAREPKAAAAPAAPKPAENKSSEIKPAEMKSAESKSTASTSAEQKSADADLRTNASGPFKDMPREEAVAIVRRAVEGSRIDLYLQPIMTLPQRKVRYYEAMTRLRGDGGEVLLPGDFIGPAEAGGLMPAIDNMLLLRCVQVVRRLQTKNREIGLFCNISGATLGSSEFPQITEFLEANRALASSLVLEFAQGAVRQMGPIEFESLSALADLGFRFSMDRMTDLHVEPREFSERGFRFVKVPASLLLNRAGLASDIHPADFSDLLGRFGIDLIAEKIESEGTVVDLLDYDVRFGQGFLFSPPRPVRNEVLQGLTSRPPVSGMRDQTAPSPTSDVPPARGPEPLAPTRPGERRPISVGQLAREVIRRA